MPTRFARLFGLMTLLAAALAFTHLVAGQQPPPNPEPLPEVPRGIDVQARGPVHEAFASPSTEAAPSPAVAKKPPAPIEEMPPAEKPEGDVVWVGGYWHWEEDRSNYLWVSGCWRTVPAGRSWVPGYWREQNDSQWQWVAGFWGAADKVTAKATEVTYQPEPPAPPQVAPPGAAPNPESFYVPGNWYWSDGRYVWRTGYWARVQPNYVWIPGHYRWTPSGYIYIAGYWDYALARRGMLYAPVVVDPLVVGPGFVYTPYYAVPDGMVVDAFWVRPAYCHYYYGDYYGPVYGRCGYVSCVVYSRDHYDGIIVYRTYEYRSDPRWHETQVNIYLAREGGRAPLPPRTLREQIVLNNRGGNVNVAVALAPGPRVAAAQGVKVVVVPHEERMQARVRSETLQKAAVQQRMAVEAHRDAAIPKTPRTATLQVPAHAGAKPLPTAPAASHLTQPTTPQVHPGMQPGQHPGATPPHKGPPGKDEKKKDEKHDK